jgi:hypothetical protein
MSTEEITMMLGHFSMLNEGLDVASQFLMTALADRCIAELQAEGVIDDA